MAKAKAQVSSKKKQWYPIFSPSFKDANLGETYVSDPEKAIGRIVDTNLRNVIRNTNQENTYIQFKIVEGAGDKFKAAPIGYYLADEAAGKFSRPGSTRIDESFTATTEDGQTVRIKPMLITVNRVPHSKRAALVKKTKEMFRNRISQTRFNKLVKDIIGYDLQNSIKNDLSITYPVANLKIKKLIKEDEAEVNNEETNEEVEDESETEDEENEEETESEDETEEESEDKSEDEEFSEDFGPEEEKE